MNSDCLVSLNNASLGYESRMILENISLEIRKNTFSALLGTNGSGKTTLLKTIAGIIKPISGSIQYPLKERNAIKLGYVPQRESLDPLFLLSGFEVAHMGTFHRIRPGRMAPHDERVRVLECLHLAGAESFAGQQFSELSGGQKQRILIARALASQPDLLLLDEPTAGIDIPSAESIMEMLTRLNRTQNLTILMVIHDLIYVRKYVPDVIWLHHGSIIQGTAKELLTSEKLSELLELSIG